MKVTLSIDSKEAINLNLANAVDAVCMLDDVERHASIFSRFAEHPCYDVRIAVANNACLPYKTLRLLARDPSIDVVCAIANNKSALKKFNVSLFEEMIARDVSVAAALAGNLGRVDEEIREELMDILDTHDDPKVVNLVLDFKREQLIDF